MTKLRSVKSQNDPMSGRPTPKSRDHNGDPVVHAVLDELLELTGWDPSCFFPEQNLSRDLELKRDSITTLLCNLEQKLELSVSPDIQDCESMTLRDLVSIFKNAIQLEQTAA